jgi:FKBP-type peptidyl-prolyl cis-trans isomerase
VEINYRGTLIDGTELESSEAGKSATFKVATVIPGWKEALKLMPVGSKWQLFVPPELGYSERGSDRIPPNSILIFEVELISIK